MRYLLLGMNLLYAAIGMFGLTTFIGLSGAFLAGYAGPAIGKMTSALIVTALLGMLFLLSAVLTFIVESACARRMLRLRAEPEHPDLL